MHVCMCEAGTSQRGQLDERSAKQTLTTQGLSVVALGNEKSSYPYDRPLISVP